MVKAFYFVVNREYDISLNGKCKDNEGSIKKWDLIHTVLLFIKNKICDGVIMEGIINIFELEFHMDNVKSWRNIMKIV